MKRIDPSIQLLYAEFLQRCLAAMPNLRGVTFAPKVIKGRRYWYLELVVGSTRRQFSLGPETPELLAQIQRQKDLHQQAQVEATARETLVALLAKGGLMTPGFAEGRVLEVLSQGGVFLAGGTLVGSIAFPLMGNMLGVKWEHELYQTQDVDLTSPRRIEIVLSPDFPELETLLLESGMGFFPIPALDRKSPSTSYKIRNQSMQVDILTPIQGRPTGQPVYLPHLKCHAYPVRYLEFLLEDTQIVAVPFRSGFLANIPAPARFALHKLVVASRRPASQATKAGKDRQQAHQLLEMLLEERPGDVCLALKAVRKMPKGFRNALQDGIRLLPESMAEVISEHWRGG